MRSVSSFTYYESMFKGIKKMISIVGNIKLDGNETRLKYFYACLRSYAFLKNECQLLLNIDCDIILYNEVDKEIRLLGFKEFQLSNQSGNYGDIYCNMLNLTRFDYVLNFQEDQFMILDDKDVLLGVLETMKKNKVDICKSSFFKVEQNSSRTVSHTFINRYGKVYLNNEINHKQYQQHYNSRFYIGVNFLTTLEFAKKFWSRKFDSKRPHEWEVGRYHKEFEHICMIPNIEIQAAVCDNHGQVGTCLLERNEKKFLNIFNKINK